MSTTTTTTMQALRIELEGEVTSFRYPHFMWGIQPTFEMPPPATIYGHICSAVGTWIDPASVRFAYHFTHCGKFADLEHVHTDSTIAPATPRQRQRYASQGYDDVRRYGESSVIPFSRELLFRPRLVLYLDRPDLAPAFRRPRYAVVLGRSQDLCTYPPGAVQVVSLERWEQVYYEHTLLPLALARNIERGVTVFMPRYIAYEQGRQPHFAQYLMLNERVVPQHDHERLTRGAEWCDPAAPMVRGHGRAVVWHSFVEQERREGGVDRQ